jgi:type II secretory ATPase GspE/PulE/Tfp pilus assembly ATPase PilB-like protein
VRYRVDGDLRLARKFRPQKLINPITARIKIMSNLSITEKRLPQDGRVTYKDGLDLVLDDALRATVATKGISADAIKRMAVENSGMTTLYWDAMEKAREGITSINEVLAQIRADEFDARPTWMEKA